jgi:hypothetical protein
MTKGREHFESYEFSSGKVKKGFGLFPRVKGGTLFIRKRFRLFCEKIRRE